MSWYETAFRGEYLDLYYHRDDEAAKGEAAFAAEALGLKEGARVLDLACGAGRHVRALQELGHDVVGSDLSPELLARAEQVRGVRADMRTLPFGDVFDAVTCFFTSFGYFDEEGNRSTLAAVHAALKPGGAFFLDFMNATAVRATLKPEGTIERDGKTFHLRRRIEDGRVLKEVRFEDDAGAKSYTESVRLYLHQDLVRLLGAAGFDILAAYGDFDGSDFTTDSPRCILVSRKA